MKNWLLCFFAVIIGLVSVALGAKRVFANQNVPKLTVFVDGEVKELTAEDYALSVLLAESENCTDAETKKALGVAARSVGCYLSAFGCKHQEFDACDDGNCCFALGNIEDYPPEIVDECKKALKSTEGLVLTFDGAPAMALFCRCCGSATDDCAEFPYLSAVAEETPCRQHITEGVCEYSSLTPLLLFEPTFERLKENSVLIYDENQKCNFAVIGGKYFDGAELATALCSQGREFQLTFTPSGIKTKNFGMGNGFGLPLCSAEKMAKNGFDYEKIIKHYFPNLILKKIYNP